MEMAPPFRRAGVQSAVFVAMMVRTGRERRIHMVLGELNAKLMFEEEVEVEVFLTLTLMGM